MEYFGDYNEMSGSFLIPENKDEYYFLTAIYIAENLMKELTIIYRKDKSRMLSVLKLLDLIKNEINRTKKG